jgi:hypothetical protein
VRTTLRLLATAFLGLLYLFATDLLAHPRVSAEYRAHYVDRTVDCWLPNGLAGKPAETGTVEIGQLTYPEVCRFLRFHWEKVEAWGVVSHPKEAELRLPWRQGAAAVELTLRGPDRGPAPVRAAITLGDRTAEVELAREQERVLVLALPPAAEGQAWTIRLRANSVHPPAGQNGTQPGRVGLVRIRYLDRMPR